MKNRSLFLCIGGTTSNPARPRKKLFSNKCNVHRITRTHHHPAASAQKKQPEASHFRHTDHTSPSLRSINSTIIFTTYGGGTRFPAYQSCTVLNGISNLFASAVCVSVYRSQISRTVIISAPFAHTSPAIPQAPQSSRCSPPHRQHSEFPSCVDTNRISC